LGEYERTL